MHRKTADSAFQGARPGRSAQPAASKARVGVTAPTSPVAPAAQSAPATPALQKARAPRPKMSMEERAAQFMPFAALTGYYDLVREASDVHDALYRKDGEAVDAGLGDADLTNANMMDAD